MYKYKKSKYLILVPAFNELKNLPEEELVAQRMDKYAKMGVYKE